MQVEPKQQQTNPMPDAATAAAPARPPAPPREVTPRVRRRSWGEAGVRGWWMAAVVLGVVTAYVAADRVARGLADRRLVSGGVAVTATVVEVANNPRVVRPMNRDEPLPVRLTFADPRPGHVGETAEVSGELPPVTGATVAVGNTMNIRVDPADLTRWTDRTRPPSWAAELLLAAALALGTVGLLAVAVVRRGQVLATWRDAPAGRAVVVEARNSGLAPGSRLLRLAWADARDKRVFTALARGGRGGAASPGRGETIWIIAPAPKLVPALVAESYL